MTSVLTRLVARALFVPTLVVAAAILVKGYTDVGDGFAAGVVASLALLLQYLAFGRARLEAALPVRRAPHLALAGLAVAFAVLALPVLAGDPLLTHRPAPGDEPAHLGSLELITAVVFDVGIFLLVVGAITTVMSSLIAADEEAET